LGLNVGHPTVPVVSEFSFLHISKKNQTMKCSQGIYCM
jgi:hypothetical protein